MRSQPQGLLRLNRGNSLARGLVSAIVPNAAGKSFDAVGRQIKPFNTNGPAPTFDGRAAYFAQNNSGIYFPVDPAQIASYTVLTIFCRLGSSSAYASISGISYDQGNNDPYGPQFDNNGGSGADLRWSGAQSGGKFFCTATNVLSQGPWYTAVGLATSGRQELWLNGSLLGAATASGDASWSAQPWVMIGQCAATGRSPNIKVALNLVWGRALSAAEIAAVTANPWALFEAGSASSAYQSAIAQQAASGAQIVPGAGALALSTFAPIIARTANQSITPGAATMVLAGYAPTVTQTAGQNILPGAGSLALAGYAPQVQQSSNRAVSPTVASLAIVGYAPSISQSVVTNLVPQPGAVTLMGFAPTVTRTANQSLALASGSLSISGYAPSVVRTAAQAVQPGSAALALSGYAPTVTQVRVSPYPNFNQATILQQPTIYRASHLEGALNAAAALQASVAIATIMANRSINATALLSSAAINQTASFV